MPRSVDSGEYTGSVLPQSARGAGNAIDAGPTPISSSSSATGIQQLLTADMPLSAFAPQTHTPLPYAGVLVGPSSPPVPKRTAEKLWRGEHVDLSMVLPHQLGDPEPILAQALQYRTKVEKQITSIEQWVVCFSAYASMLVLKQPSRIRDFLAYQAVIVKAAHDYEGTPRLCYDSHFQSLAATVKSTSWSTPDQTIWLQYFNRALRKRSGSSALSVGPHGDSN